MAFGWAGAASGANAAVTQQRDELQKYLAQQFAQKLQQEQLALQQQSGQRAQQQLDATLESNAAAGQRAGRDQQLQEAGLRFGMLKDQPQGTQLAPADVAAFKGTPYEAGIDQKQTLPSRRIVDLQPVGQSQPTVTDPQADAGGQDYATMRPTQAQMQATGQQTARRKVVELMQRGAPRNEVLGALAGTGENITAAMLNDPQDALAARKQQADADRDTKLMIAAMGQNGKNETQGLRNDLLRIQAETARQKQVDADSAAKAAGDSVSQYGNDIGSVLADLLDEKGNLRPEVAGVVGAWDGRTPDVSEGANSAVSKIDRLIGLLDINKLREMKAQSKTGASGFGALSEKELNVLESAGSSLRNRRQGEGSYAAELKRIRDTVARPAAAGQAPGTPTAADLIQKYGGGNAR